MINTFPTMFLALLAHAILRVFIGVILVNMGFSHMGKSRPALLLAISSTVPRLRGYAPLFAAKLAVLEVVMGVMFVFGFYTQIAAIAAVLYALKMLFFKRTLSYPLMPSPLFFVLLIGVSISLFITGAGILAFDIPI